MRRPRIGLFWKLLVPFAALILIVGAFGAFLIVRDLSSRAQARLNQDLLRSSLEARALLQHRELSLLDSAELAANLQGMAQAARRGDTTAVTRLLRGVVALKADLDLVAVSDRSGAGLAAFARRSARADLRQNAILDWGAIPVARAALDASGSEKSSGLAVVDGERLLLIAAPICSGVSACASTGVAIVGMRVARLATEIAATAQSGHDRRGGLAIFDGDGALLASSGLVPGGDTTSRPAGQDLIRRTESAGDSEVHTLYSPLEVQGRPIGMVAVSLPSEPRFSPVRSAGLRLSLLLLAALLGIVGLGALLSRHILRQVRPLVEANRALGGGDLSARVPVVSGDEIGEVARGLNQMAEQLQASHETLELRVAQRTAEVQRLLAERTEFFASLSHELRTPLAVILNESDALLDDRRSKNAVSARAIKASGAQLLAVVNEILDFAKAEVGRLEIEPIPLSLSEAIDGVRPTIEGLARAGSLHLSVSVDEELPPVSADPQRLREILLNLIDNAVKYTPAGGSVALVASAEGGAVRVEIADSGPGIPAEDAGRIFEPFYRVKGTKEQRGRPSSGLGLALTRRLVEAHGGTISFEPNPGGGTTFAFTLPLASGLPRPTPGPPSKRELARGDGGRRA